MSNRKEFARLFGGVEEEDGEGFIIAMIGIICEGEEWGLISISGMMLSFLFTCLKVKVKVYCENHCDHINN